MKKNIVVTIVSIILLILIFSGCLPFVEEDDGITTYGQEEELATSSSETVVEEGETSKINSGNYSLIEFSRGISGYCYVLETIDGEYIDFDCR